MDRDELQGLRDALKKTGADTRLLDIILANTTDSDDVGGVLASFAKSFDDAQHCDYDPLPLGRSPAVSVLKTVARTVGIKAGAIVAPFSPGSVGLGWRSSTPEADADQIVDDLFKPPVRTAERDPTVDQFFNRRERAKA